MAAVVVGVAAAADAASKGSSADRWRSRCLLPLTLLLLLLTLLRSVLSTAPALLRTGQLRMRASSSRSKYPTGGDGDGGGPRPRSRRVACVCVAEEKRAGSPVDPLRSEIGWPPCLLLMVVVAVVWVVWLWSGHVVLAPHTQSRDDGFELRLLRLSFVRRRYGRDLSDAGEPAVGKCSRAWPGWCACLHGHDF